MTRIHLYTKAYKYEEILAEWAAAIGHEVKVLHKQKHNIAVFTTEATQDSIEALEGVLLRDGRPYILKGDSGKVISQASEDKALIRAASPRGF